MDTLHYASLLNSGSKSMVIDGSSITKSFSFSPGSGIVRLLSLSVILKDDGSTDLTKFGAITALSNGILLQYTIAGNNSTLATLKDNADLCNVFPHGQHFGNSAVSSVSSSPLGFGNSNNVFKGLILFPPEVYLTDSDSIQAIVRDNLTSIDVLQMGVHYED